MAAFSVGLPGFDASFPQGQAAPSGMPAPAVAHVTGRLALSRVTMPSVRLSRSRQTIARTGGMSCFVVQLIVAGSFSGATDQSRFKANAGDVLVLDMLRTCELKSQGPRTETILLWFPRVRLLPALSNDELIHGLVLKGDQAAGALIAGCLNALATHVSDLNSHQLEHFGSAAIALIARAVVPALQVGEPSAQAGITTAPTTLTAVRRFIDQNLLSKELEVDLIAGNFGLSRAALYRLFQPIGGVALYIRKQRLERAFQEITAAEYSNKRVKWVAQRYGFENFSSFIRLFRETYGMTPKMARKTALYGLPTAATPDLPSGGEDSMAHWIARLHP